MRTLCLGLIFILVSCSGIKVIDKKPLTQREKLLERYRQMRLQDKTRPQKNSKFKRYTPRRKKTPKKPKIQYVDIKEQRIEIEQNLTYFCMSKRSDERFTNFKGSCKNFTTGTLVECQSKFAAGDARLTRCVKSRLK